MNKEHLHSDGRPYTKEEFVEKIKTDEEFLKRFGNLGKIYGYQWRNWNDNIDQISELINQLKENPDSRRLLVSAWNPSDLPNMVLPPCHYGFQVYTRELSLEERKQIVKNKYFQEFYWKIVDDDNDETTIFEMDKRSIPTRAISLMWNQRSIDSFLGLPFNIASYGLLLEIIAKQVNMVPDELIGNLGDTHIYSNHIEQVKEQIGREMTTEERNEWHLINRCGGNKRDCKTDWKDFELDQQDVPKRTRQPFPLPTLKHMKTDEFYKSLSDGMSLIGHLDPTDFILENYQSHPSIKAPLSN
jgi:thymidylate synthase